MTVPPEILWLVPLVAPFIIGVLVGLLLRKGLKLLLIVAALCAVLIVSGTVSYDMLSSESMLFLLRIYDWLKAVPYSAITVIFGLALGFALG